MRKGVSTIIATILMLLITLALAGFIYTFLMGTVKVQTQGIEVLDIYCSNNIVYIAIKNIGTDSVSNITCLQTTPTGDTCSFTGLASPIAPGTSTGYLQLDTCTGSGSRYCQYRLVPNIGKPVPVTVGCT